MEIADNHDHHSSTFFKIKLKNKIIPNHDNHEQVVAEDHEEEEDELEEGEIREDNDNDDEQQEEELAAESVNNTSINDDNHDQDELSVIKEGGLRVCPICNKVFSSGKALGGHMRVHKPRPEPEPKPNGSPRLEQPIMCTICKKEFRSQKSLFGHMRSHPDRQWRGMQPPPQLIPRSHSPSPSPCPDSVPGNLVECHWGVTGRWGRKAYTSEDSLPITCEEAAGILMLLKAHGGERNSSSEQTLIGRKKKTVFRDDDEEHGVREKKKRKLEFCDPDEVYYHQNMGDLVDSDSDSDNNEEIGECSTKKDGEEDIMVNKPLLNASKNENGKKVRDLVDFSSDNEEIGECSTIKEGEEDIMVNKPIMNTSRNRNRNRNGNRDGNGKKKRIRDLDCSEESGGGNKWKCTICNKIFPTPQALGGHMSSHNKEKNNSSNINHVYFHIHTDIHNDRSGWTDLGASGDSVDHNEVAVVYKCKICGKVFPSGQALGGHQRCHYVMPDRHLEDPSSSTSPPDRTNCQMGQQGNNVTGFDLNVEPLLNSKDEKEEDQAKSTLELLNS